MVDAGLIVIVGLISPFTKERDWARSLFKENQFKEIFISTSLKECEHRDTKGLYEKARRGEVKDFTGIEISSTNDTYLDFDDDSRIIEAEVTSFVASNCTSWSWELEEDGDDLCLLFTLDDDSDADDH